VEIPISKGKTGETRLHDVISPTRELFDIITSPEKTSSVLKPFTAFVCGCNGASTANTTSELYRLSQSSLFGIYLEFTIEEV
jgi:hypothetical protein